jgi:hypothetical protein
MKARALFYIYILVSVLPSYGQTEHASYGFKGRVKSVIYYIYQDVNLDKNGNLIDAKIIDAKVQPFIERAMYFDKKGNIDSTIEVLSEGRFYEKYITYHSHVSNKLRSTIKYRYYLNDVIDETKYTWSESNAKCSFKGKGITSFNRGHRILSYNHRESRGEYIQETKKGELLLKESYKNEFDDNWNLVKTNYTNSEKGDYTILYEYDELDEVGNYTQVKLIYEDSKKLQRFIQKAFTYY